jgi:hypothetical protein
MIDPAAPLLIRIYPTAPHPYIEVAIPPVALKWLEDHGMGPAFLLEAVGESPASALFEVAKKTIRAPEVGIRESADAEEDSFKSQNADGSLNAVGTVRLESYLKTHSGAFTLVALVMAYYRVSEEAARKALYVRRGKKLKVAGSRFYNTFRGDVNAALDALEIQGWKVARPNQKGSPEDRKTWRVEAPVAEDVHDAPQ